MRFNTGLIYLGFSQCIMLLTGCCLIAEEETNAKASENAQTDYEAIYFFAGAVFVLIGLTKGIPAFFEWRRDINLLLHGTETTGIINDSFRTATGEGGEDSGTSCLFAEFKTAGNVTCKTIAPFRTMSPRKYLNTEVAIIYDPGNPEHSRFKDEMNTRRLFLVFIFYMLMLSSGLGLFLYLFIVV